MTTFINKYQNNEDSFYGQYVVPPAEQLVKFNVGQPSPSILPLDMVKNGMSYVQSICDPSVLQYGDISGYKQFRECLGKFLTDQYQRGVNSQELFITNGITHAITFICSLMMPSGSTIYVEEPTYFLAINIFKELGLKIISIPIEKDGIDIEVLEKELEKSDDTKNHMLYTIPTFHNPTSYTMSHEKRLRLAELTKKYNKFYVIADEVYQMLYFDDLNKPPTPMCYYTDMAISLGSFSKILSPALRLGWIQTKNKNIMDLLVKSGQYDSSGGSSPVTQAIIHGIIGCGDLDKYVLNCRQFLKTNCTHMVNRIKEKLSDYVNFVVPNGGYFVWLEIKDNIDVKILHNMCEKYKITVAPGTRFSANGKCQNFIRLSFSYYDLKGIDIGVERLCELFKTVQSISNKCLVAVLGYRGKLGCKIVDALNSNKNFVFIEGIDRDFELKNIDLYSVIIDVSRPEATHTLILNLLERQKKIPLIIGTTGLTQTEMNIIREYSAYSPISIVSNFSMGIPQLLKFVEKNGANKWSNWNISMIEKHHKNKIDQPSGTALTLQKAIGQKVQIESIREGDIIGDHILVFDKNDEQIIIEHHAKNRDVFANGALQYCSWITKQSPKLYYGMEKSRLKFMKYTGSGNDFIIIDNDSFNKFDMKKHEFVLKYSSRGLSVGSDGVIFVDVDPIDNIINWEYYNSDGNRVSMCGNGSRCVVQYALDNGFVLNDNTVLKNGPIETKVKINNDGTFSVMIHDNFSFENIVNIVCPELEKKYDNFSMIDMRVPHMVFKLNEELPCPNELGQKVRQLGFVTNTNLYMEKNGKLYIRTYERGVWDETLACGTGCCAVAFYEALQRKKLGFECEYELVVKSGESIFVKICPNGDATFKIYLRGSAVKVFDGVI